VIVDASAIIAIVHAEEDAASFAGAVERAGAARISAANYFEAAIIVDSSRNPISIRQFDEILSLLGIAIEPVSVEQAKIARQAYRDFGKGSGHPAGLNFGDCFAYALAKETGEPLLFKGSDFGHTDVKKALDP